MDKMANAITNYYVRKKIIAEDKHDIYCYGFKLIIADIINYSIIIILSIVFDRFTEGIIFLISLCGLRQFSGGFHAKSFLLCRLSMIITYMCVMFLTDVVIHTELQIIIVLSINVLSIIFISIFSPVEHPNKPLMDKQKRSNKNKSIITSVILSLVSISLKSFDMKSGVTISTTLLAVIVLMIISLTTKKGGGKNV